ncbi:MAG: hypothetical protein JXX29_08155 [Deltaproteobacteria bacterium]|nr:hypothetical protein [Deltaproteobacteria bacterium]MBN2671632.1 hypothetical protein [Deltaproteobacteria bacterium]
MTTHYPFFNQCANVWRASICALSLLWACACHDVSNAIDDSGVNPDTSTDTDTNVNNGTDTSTPVENTYTGVDIILVVDNSGSMAQEQEMLSTALFSLINSLVNPLDSKSTAPLDDIRIGVTTSDMGVSYGGTPSTYTFSPHPVCSEGDGMGDNGAFVTAYLSTEINLQENIIPCDASAAQCPTGWSCDYIDAEGVGRCGDPNGDGTAQSCPPSAYDVSRPFVDNHYWTSETMAFTTACLSSSVGTEGCAFEQQLAAGAAGMRNNDGFVRADSLTAVIVISDEEDCSLADDDWHSVEELATPERNVACGLHPEYMETVIDMKDAYNNAKMSGGGPENAILFAAIIGVPPVPECQGSGAAVSGCLDVPLEYGTVGDPEIIERLDPNGNPSAYYEYACERFDYAGYAITQAYPASRIVELAQLFGNMGYIYSICNEDWTPAMNAIAARITEIVN